MIGASNHLPDCDLCVIAMSIADELDVDMDALCRGLKVRDQGVERSSQSLVVSLGAVFHKLSDQVWKLELVVHITLSRQRLFTINKVRYR